MISTLKRAFALSFPFTETSSKVAPSSVGYEKNSAKAAMGFSADRHPSRAPLQDIKTQMQTALRGCDTPQADRTKFKVNASRTAKDLWMLRSEVYQTVALEISQHEATQRINGLLHNFSGWIPERQRSKI